MTQAAYWSWKYFVGRSEFFRVPGTPCTQMVPPAHHQCLLLISVFRALVKLNRQMNFPLAAKQIHNIVKKMAKLLHSLTAFYAIGQNI